MFFVAWGRSGTTPAVFFDAWERSGATPVVFFVAWGRSGATPVVFFVAWERSGATPVGFLVAWERSGATPVGFSVSLGRSGATPAVFSVQGRPPDAKVSRRKTPKASGLGLSYKGLIAFYTSVDSSTCGRQQCIKAFCCRSGLTPPSLGLDSERRSSVNSSARRLNRLDCWLRFLRRFRVRV